MEMPIMGYWCRKDWKDKRPIESVPFEMFIPHSEQCYINHQQTPERIRQRGGFSACEAVAVLEDRKWAKMDQDESNKKLLEIVSEFKLKRI